MNGAFRPNATIERNREKRFCVYLFAVRTKAKQNIKIICRTVIFYLGRAPELDIFGCLDEVNTTNFLVPLFEGMIKHFIAFLVCAITPFADACEIRARERERNAWNQCLPDGNLFFL